MPARSVWERCEWAVNTASGPGAKLIFDGTPWAFRLEETPSSAGRKLEFGVHVTEGAPPIGAGWGDFALSIMGWSQYPWLGGAKLPPWSPQEEPLYQQEIQQHLSEVGPAGNFYGLRLEGLLNEQHLLRFFWIPDALDQSLPNLLLIGMQPVEEMLSSAPRALRQDGTAHGDPR